MVEWSRLSKLPANKLRALQLAKLRFLCRQLLPLQPAIQTHQNSRQFTSVRFWDDFEQLPFFSKLDLIPTDAKPTRSRDYILQPSLELIKKSWPKLSIVALMLKKMVGINVRKDLEREFKPIHIHFTTGRSANQIPFLFTKYDLEALAQTGRRVFETIGAEPNEIVVNAFPFAPHLAFWFGQQALEHLGLLSLHTGGGKIMGTTKIIKAIETLKATVLLVMPGYGYHLVKEAVATGANLSTLRFIVMGGERVSPGLRKKMKQLLERAGAKHAKILATYAFTEAKTAWVQCHENSGFHLYPDMEYIELIGKDGKPVGEGRSGEVTYTSLGWRGTVVVRYQTGDFCKKLIVSEPCPYCGRTTPRLDQSIERRSDMVQLNLSKIKGELVNLNELHNIVHEISSVTEWQAEITKKNNDPYEVDELVIYLAFRTNRGHQSDVVELIQGVRESLGILPVCKVIPEKELTIRLGLDTELKEKRIIDRRKD